MKFIKYITPALFCAALTLQSCEHFLDTKPMESYSEDLVWSPKIDSGRFCIANLQQCPPLLSRYPHGGTMDLEFGHAPELPE